MKHILITGCSWASGVWGTTSSGHYGLIDQGITTLFENHGYRVINLSQPGSDPWGVLYPLKSFLECNKHIEIYKVYYIQTDIGRSFFRKEVTLNKLRPNLSNTIDRLYSELYNELDAIALTYNRVISVIGGLTDITVSLKDYSNLNLEVPSWCQLLDSNLSLTALVDPVAFNYLNKLPSVPMEQVLNFLQLADSRHDFYNNNAQWFWPDGKHPNLTAHKMLFNKLMENINNETSIK